MGAILPRRLAIGPEPQPGLMDQRCGLQSLAGRLLGHLVRGELAQLLVNQRQQFFSGRKFASLQGRLTFRNINPHGIGGGIPVDSPGFEAEANLPIQSCCRSSECPCVLAFNGPDKTSRRLSLPKKENQAQVRSLKSLYCGRGVG